MDEDPLTRALLQAVQQAREVTERAGRTGQGLLRLAAAGPLRIVGQGMRLAEGAVVEGLRQALDIPELRRAVAMLEAQGATGATVDRMLDAAEVDGDDRDRLRRTFGALLEQSLDPAAEGLPHPAFRRILAQLSPDEARILRLFRAAGPQAVMDVVATRSTIGRSVTTVASNLTRVGEHAGCLQPEHGSLYLANLERLGLVDVHDTELVGHDDYDLLQVSAAYLRAVREATAAGNRARAVRRHARLSALGRELLAIVLPDDEPA